MLVDGCEFMTQVVTKFHNTLLVEGWFFHPADQLVEVTLEDDELLNQISTVGMPSDIELGRDLGFRLQALRRAAVSPLEATIRFKTREGRVLSQSLDALCEDRQEGAPTARLAQRFRSIVRQTTARPVVLDIGGRARSGKDYRSELPDLDVRTVDIIAAEGVDIVADAHELSEHIPPGSVDAIYSVSTFEHLLMPWKVALEMNKVLKPGGLAFIHTHQTVGIHDAPWDFLRFSDASWDGIFNALTGFEILGREMDNHQFILPWIFRLDKLNTERSAGFEGSAVLVRKTSESALDWPVRVSDAINTTYVDG